MELLGLNITWLGHAGFLIKEEGKVIVIDPFQVSESGVDFSDEKNKADVVFITHEHFDHCSVDDLLSVCKLDTVVVTIADCVSKLNGKIEVKDVKVVEPGSKVEVLGVKVEAVASYNVNKFREPGVPFHPKEDGKVGFILEVSGLRLYHAGDTDVIAEMKHLGTVDIAMVPVSGTYVMTAEEGAEAVSLIKPKISIPMHYGAIVGSREDADRFKDLVKEGEVRVFEKG